MIKKLSLLLLCCISILVNAQSDKDMTARLKPIKENFKRINSITKWEKIERKDVFDKSSEGGEVSYYYSNNGLEKIIAIYYGESGKYISEYYLQNDTLSFVFEQEHRYNRPIYWTPETAKENGDSEAFDSKKSQISEIRSYFENGKIIYQLPENAPNIEQKEQEIKNDFEEYLLLLSPDNIRE